MQLRIGEVEPIFVLVEVLIAVNVKSEFFGCWDLGFWDSNIVERRVLEQLRSRRSQVGIELQHGLE